MQVTEKKIAIISNGKPSSISLSQRAFQRETGSQLSNTNHTIIACDGATENLELLNLEADYLIGDFDSIAPKNLEEYEKNKQTKVILDPDQSKTDTRIAIELAIKEGASEIFILTATGGRLDHLLANILDLKIIPENISAKIIDEYSVVEYRNKSCIFKGKLGETLSIIALSDIEELSLSGLKYPLSGHNIKAGEPLICNKFTGNEAKIDFKSGEILVIRAYD
ncbi:MAG: thiamine diphosphokinase [Candidatus Caenarcaniphilales bacterium]|nr:thiamine diphosphokinase [Candidatus Caenarcaniphilales bacterium]